jgi:hypothetical protein
MTPQTSDAADAPLPQPHPPLKPHQKLIATPATAEANPAVLQPGQTLEITVEVHNSTPQTDRFWLTCAGLPKDWIRIRYEGGQPQPVSEFGDFVEPRLILPAGERGQVILSIQPPSNAPAIPYTATLQLHCPMMLEPRSTWFYLRVLPIQSLYLELKTVQGRVRQAAGQYEICLHNQGNTERRIALRVREANPQPACTYLMTPTRFWVLPPNDCSQTQLWVKPKHAWKRPLWGSRSIQFWVEVDDRQQLPLPTDQLQGTLIWQGRPFWQVGLGLLASLGSLGAIGLLATGLLTAVSGPKILEFAAENATVQEVVQESGPQSAQQSSQQSATGAVRLNWQVQNPAQIQSLRLTNANAKGGAKSIVYDFSQGVPKELQTFCTLQQVLRCKGVPINAREIGNYELGLELYPKKSGSPIDRQKTTVSIQPQIPTIAAFKINDKDAPAKLTIAANTQAQPLNFSWLVKGGQSLTVELLPSPGKVQAEGKLVYTPNQPGVKQFTLKATNAAGQQVSRSVTIEAPPVAAAPPPQKAAEAPNLPQLPIVDIDPLPSIPAPSTRPPAAAGRNPSPSPQPSASSKPLTVPPSELPPQFN